MMMKGIGLVGLCLLFSACTLSPPANNAHQTAEKLFAQTESAFTEVNLASAIAGSTPASSVTSQQLGWRFVAGQALSVVGDPAANLVIKPAADDAVSLVVLNDAKASIKGARVGDTLGLRVATHQGSKVVLYVPEKIHSLFLSTFNVLHGLPSAHLRYLNLLGCSNVKLSASGWMLEYLRINHSSLVGLAGIKTPYLIASINDSNTITVQGTMPLRALDVQDSQGVTWYWLNSPLLTLKIKNSGVLLAGNVMYANVMVQGGSHLDAKYLSTQRLFVQTKDQAVADVRAVEALNALAEDSSNIYYYTQPAVLSRYSRDKGSILYQGDQLPRCLMPYCALPARILPG
jgi:hypothetical protein